MGSQKKNGKKSPSQDDDRGMTYGAPAIWRETMGEVEQRVSPIDFDRYIRELRCLVEYDGVMLVAARSVMAADRVASEHGGLIQRAWLQFDPKKRRLRFDGWERLRPIIGDFVDGDDPWAGDAESEAAAPEIAEDEALEISGERAALSFDNLVVADHNRRAVELVRHILADGDMPARIVLIHGEQGVGKTHLLTALQRALHEARDGRTSVYCTAEDFQSAYIEGAMARDTRELKARLRSGDVVIMEDLQTIASATAKGTDNEFCRNLRAITEAGGLLILTADTPPGEMDGFSRRVMSQLRGAASVEITPPDKETRKAIVARRAETLKQEAPQFEVTSQMIELICQRVRGHGRELYGALASLYTEAGMGQLAPTTDMLSRVLDRQAGVVTQPKISEIKAAVIQLFDITRAELEGPRKMQRVVYPRHLAMYLCREMTDKSFPTIARSFGGRDHTSILYAEKRVNEYLRTRTDTAQHLDRLRELIYEMQG